MWPYRRTAPRKLSRRWRGSTVAWVITFAVFVPLVVNTIDARRRAADLSHELLSSESVEHDLRDLDRALTSATRLAIAGAPSADWEPGYASARTRLQQRLRDATRRVRSEALLDAIEAARGARDTKSAIEEHTLEHVRRGELAAAQQTLDTVEYHEQSHQFAHAMQHFETAQLEGVLTAAHAADLRMRTTLTWSVTLFACTVFVWALLLHASRRREERLRREIDERECAQRALERSTAATSALERQLHRSQRMQSLGQLACGIAHEFGNLALVLTGQVAALREPGIARARTERALTGVGRVAEEARRISRSLLCFAGRLQVERRRVQVDRVVRDTASLLVHVLPSGIVLRLDAEPGCEVDADPVEIEQILLNLALNARDAMPDGGVLRIACRPDGSVPAVREVVIEVSDEGEGMAAEIRARIFEPLFTTHPDRGTGLGLSIVSRIVEDLGGRIDVRSRPGEGSTFTVRLPARATVDDRLRAPPTNGGSGEVDRDVDHLEARTVRS